MLRRLIMFTRRSIFIAVAAQMALIAAREGSDCIARFRNGRFIQEGDCVATNQVSESYETQVEAMRKTLAELQRRFNETQKLMEDQGKPDCEIYPTGGGCVWIHLDTDIRYREGVRICRQKSSVVARITNQADYKDTLALLKTHIRRMKRVIGNAWFNETIDISKETGRDSVTPFRVWYKHLKMPLHEVNATQLYLYSDTSTTVHDGMINRNPETDTASGVIWFYQAANN